MVTAVTHADGAVARERRHPGAAAWALTRSTLARAWRDRVLGLAAEAGFWQLLSLPSMLLAVLGVIGYFSGALGPDTLHDLEESILRGAKHVIVPSAVESTVRPALDRILAGGRADVVSIGFIVSFWTGSSAMATYVNTITIAYGLRHHRDAVRSRIVALQLYLAFVAVGVVLLPLLVLGPTIITRLTPHHWHHVVHIVTLIGYWPVVALISLALLTSLYHLAIPVRTPWRRAVPGAIVGLCLWLGGSGLLRVWLTWSLPSSKATCGPPPAPGAAPVFTSLPASASLPAPPP